MPRLNPTRLRKRAIRVASGAAMSYARRRGDLLMELFHPPNWANPFPIYQAMREQGPVYYSKLARTYVLTTYDGAATALRDPRFRARRPEGQGGEGAGLGNADSLVHLDAPRHTHLRKLLTTGFSLRAIEDMTDWIDGVGHDLLDGVTGESDLDFVLSLAFPLPVRVISHILGVPAEQRDQLRDWGLAVGPTIDPFMTPAQLYTAQRASRQMIKYFRELVAERKRQPRENDVLTNLIAATSDDDVALTDGELLATCQLMLVAGFGTSVGMLGSMCHLLVDRPEVWAELKAHPELVPNAVEEVLRLESPVQMTVRNLEEDVEIAGHTLPSGARVLQLLGGGNRDPQMFPDPDRLDLHRDNSARHLAFSPGIHHCLGAPLARLEGRLALQAMLERMPEIHRAGPTQRLPHLNARVLNGLPVTVRPGVLERARSTSA